MEIVEQRRRFIIHTVYLAIWLGCFYLLLKYALPLLAPFAIAFLLASVLNRPIKWLAKVTHLPRALVSIASVLLLYAVIGLLFTMAGIRLLGVVGELIFQLPTIYRQEIEPALMGLSGSIQGSVLSLDPQLLAMLEELWTRMLLSLESMVTSLSMQAVGGLSLLASALPGMFVKILITIISTFFMAIDYETMVHFFLEKLSEKNRTLVSGIQTYVLGTLWKYIRSYALIMTITFLELSVGLRLIGLEHPIVIAFLIAIFDILPILGTGGIMLPWVVLSVIQGNPSRAVGLLILYLVITVIRNILEPKIVGNQVGLHPVATLISMYAGVQLFGILGLFGLPVLLSLFVNLHKSGTLSWFQNSGKVGNESCK